MGQLMNQSGVVVVAVVQWYGKWSEREAYEDLRNVKSCREEFSVVDRQHVRVWIDSIDAKIDIEIIVKFFPSLLMVLEDNFSRY